MALKIHYKIRIDNSLTMVFSYGKVVKDDHLVWKNRIENVKDYLFIVINDVLFCRKVIVDDHFVPKSRQRLHLPMKNLSSITL